MPTAPTSRIRQRRTLRDYATRKDKRLTTSMDRLDAVLQAAASWLLIGIGAALCGLAAWLLWQISKGYVAYFVDVTLKGWLS